MILEEKKNYTYLNKTILIVDDVSNNIKVASNIIESLGVSIAYAMSGEEALEIVKREKPSLILLDIMMPGMDGYEVCRRLKNDVNYSFIPIIFLTANSDIEGIVKGFDLGAIDYVTKPFNKKELYVRVRTHLNSYLLQDKILHKLNSLMDEHKELTEQLIQQSKLASLGEALGAISHQWKQPMSIISVGSINLMMRESLKESPDPAILKNIESIDTQIKFMISTINDFKNFFVKDTEKTSFSLVEAIYELIAIFSSKYVESKITVNINSKIKEEIYVFGHKNMYKQALLNLLSNAIEQIVKVDPRNRNILIECDLDGEYGVTQIIDYAGQIPDEDIEKIFEQFYTTKGQDGTGIGLSMSKKIIEAEGGELIVSNIKDGVNFRIKMPLTK